MRYTPAEKPTTPAEKASEYARYRSNELTKREQFAVQLAAALIASNTSTPVNPAQLSANALRYADALMEALADD